MQGKLSEIRSKVFLEFRVDLNQLMQLGFRASLGRVGASPLLYTYNHMAAFRYEAE